MLVRAKSINKPIVQELKAAGAELIIGDISEPEEKIEEFLKGVNVLISMVLVMVDQKPMLRAAKKAGVGRVIPSDFGPTAPKGVMEMHDFVSFLRILMRLKLCLTHTKIGNLFRNSASVIM